MKAWRPNKCGAEQNVGGTAGELLQREGPLCGGGEEVPWKVLLEKRQRNDLLRRSQREGDWDPKGKKRQKGGNFGGGGKRQVNKAPLRGERGGNLHLCSRNAKRTPPPLDTHTGRKIELHVTEKKRVVGDERSLSSKPGFFSAGRIKGGRTNFEGEKKKDTVKRKFQRSRKKTGAETRLRSHRHTGRGPTHGRKFLTDGRLSDETPHSQLDENEADRARKKPKKTKYQSSTARRNWSKEAP